MRFLTFAFLLFFVFSCTNDEKNRANLIDFVPQDASIIIKTSNLEDLKSSINNSDFLKRISIYLILYVSFNEEGLEKNLNHFKHFIVKLDLKINNYYCVRNQNSKTQN